MRGTAVAAWAKPVVRHPEAALRVTEARLNSDAAATRPADPSFPDAKPMASAVAADRRSPAGGNGAGGSHS
ncbi:hypothetical protein ACFZB0_17275 [Streptomyces rubiginosohelvolus]|uniref:hypothetical protein n=1 Tax=Streptomyces TaxID=1883 RepID=UPI00359C7974